MSRIYFHSLSEPAAELRGSERAYLGGISQNVGEGMLNLQSTYSIDRLRELLVPGHPMNRIDSSIPGWLYTWGKEFLQHVSMMGAFRGPVLQYKDHPLDSFSLMLNTALAVGNDQVRLAARLHGGCEVHAWVDGPDRAWLADLMQTGLDNQIFRKTLPYYEADGTVDRYTDQGWDQVIELLRKRDDEPVVTSFSVTDQFPNRAVAEWKPREGETEEFEGDSWYDLPDVEKWQFAMARLRENEGGKWGGQMRPDTFATSRFGNGLTVLDLYAPDWEDRCRDALGC